ncbi:hypothetical protein [Bradyrhizobium lablabi]|uniref:hypothetical protein n=1 Tax=Bradyrhizobium lablabi TaxID=722472 RepID=UPI0020121C7C
MAYRMHWALLASVSVAALILASSSDLFARSGSVVARGGFTSPHSAVRHHGRNLGIFWPSLSGDDYGGYNAPLAEVPPAAVSNDINYTYKYDVPWDWAHRYPPAVAPSDRPYVSSCPTETVTVPGRGGVEQTVNVIRCY